MNIQLYTIKNLTNLHVGDSGGNFNIVDNQVQKDPKTNIPVIHSSSLKGAFREHFTQQGSGKNFIEYIFGPDNTDNNSHKTGAYSFFEASMLSMPVRSNKHLYYHATTKEIVQKFYEELKNFDISIETNFLDQISSIKPEDNKPVVLDGETAIKIEDFQETKTANIKLDDTAKELFGERVVLFSENDFKSLDLPVFARNHLENGVSKNLWYEEAVPKDSRFYFFIAKPSNIYKDDKKDLENYEKRFEENINTLQIGANKSIGYGFCQIKRI